MKQTWRWFGPEDPVTLMEIRQAGAEAIVTSLHHIPNGNIWTSQEIKKRINELAKYDFTWELVESLPINESIKLGSPERDKWIENYITSLKNIANEGIRLVVYNFMALTDWTRTDLDFHDPDGAKTIRFDMIDLAMFDLYILKRAGSESDYSTRILNLADLRFKSTTKQSRDALSRIILMGLPGTVEDLSLDEFREKLALYHRIGKSGMRDNLVYFLEKVLPVAEQCGLQLAIHADDPPFSILGLPRIVSDSEDLEFITAISGSSSNTLCFCSGTLGAGEKNEVNKLLGKFASNISFVHLRNVKLEENGSFYESKLFEGSLDIIEIAKILSEEEKRRGTMRQIPYRPDHGQAILSDHLKPTYPGYPLIGRLKSLAELRGIFKTLEKIC